MINFNCPHCNATIETDDIYAGQKGACPRCGKDLTVPMANAAQPQKVTPSVKHNNFFAIISIIFAVCAITQLPFIFARLPKSRTLKQQIESLEHRIKSSDAQSEEKVLNLKLEVLRLERESKKRETLIDVYEGSFDNNTIMKWHDELVSIARDIMVKNRELDSAIRVDKAITEAKVELDFAKEQYAKNKMHITTFSSISVTSAVLSTLFFAIYLNCTKRTK